MGKGYLKPEVICYRTGDFYEMTGPVQTQYAGPTLYFQEAGEDDTSVPAEYSQAAPQAQTTIYKIV